MTDLPELPAGDFAAVLDANVLYPAPLRDLFMQLAVARLFRARWSDRIHDEWTRNVLARRPDLSAERLARTRRLMDAHAPGSLVAGYEPLIGGLHLPDPDDRHVLAAALRAGAEGIVTFNLRDFPPAILGPLGVAAWHPDEFVCALLGRSPEGVAGAVREQRRNLARPPVSPDGLLDTLASQGLPRTANRLRADLEAIR